MLKMSHAILAEAKTALGLHLHRPYQEIHTKQEKTSVSVDLRCNLKIYIIIYIPACRHRVCIYLKAKVRVR